MDTTFDPAWIDALEPGEVYKHDARSKVWRIDAPDGRAFVVKQFTYSPIKQLLAELIGIHPAQRERRCYRHLLLAKLPVVPIVAHGVKRSGFGARYWLVTPYIGISLYNLFYEKHLDDTDQRECLLEAVGALTRELIAKRFFNRDHKASNILVDGEGKPMLIDVGGVRRRRGKADDQRMLRNLSRNLADSGATEADLSRLAQACRQNTSPG